MIFLLDHFQYETQIESPTHWSYGIKKIGNNTYEVHLLATIDDGWHIYAQVQPEDAVATATKISFAQNQFVSIIGKTTEHGKKEIYHNAIAGITDKEYADKVDFIQKIKINSKGSGVINGTITYQCCTDKKCLPENTISFSIPMK